MVDLAPAAWGIGNVATISGAEELQAQIFTPTSGDGTISVYNTAGELVFRQAVTLSAPSVILTIPTAGWAGGEYFLRVVANQGKSATKAFMKF